MSTPLVMVTAVLAPGAVRANELRPNAEDLLRRELGATGTWRLCPACGSSTHGHPGVIVPHGKAPHVSLAYAPGIALIAWSYDAPVGVDVELDGPDVGDVDRQEWTRVEAVLKAGGEGLRRDPSTVAGDKAWTSPVPLPQPWVGSVAMLGVDRAEISWPQADPAAQGG